MKLTLPEDELRAYVTRLLEAHAPDGATVDLTRVVPIALERTEHCFSRVAMAGYCDANGQAVFDHLHGDQFAMFLYFAANTAWKDFAEVSLAKKLTLLNRDRHALVVMYDTALPEIFLVPHTVGTVIGKADYHNYTVFCQNVTVTSDYAELHVGEGVIFFPGSFAGGHCSIGDGVVLTANTTVIYENVPPHMLVRGASPKLDMRPRKRDLLARFFKPPYPGSERTS